MKSLKVGLFALISFFMLVLNPMFTTSIVVASDNDLLSEHYFDDFYDGRVGNQSYDAGWLEFNHSDFDILPVRDDYDNVVGKKVNITRQSTPVGRFNITHNYDYVIGSRVVLEFDWYNTSAIYYWMIWATDSGNLVIGSVWMNATMVGCNFGTLGGGGNITDFYTSNYSRTDVQDNDTLLKLDFLVLNDNDIYFAFTVGHDTMSELFPNGWMGNNTCNITSIYFDMWNDEHQVHCHSVDIICADDWYEETFFDEGGFVKFLGTEYDSPSHDWLQHSNYKVEPYQIMQWGSFGSYNYLNCMMVQYDFQDGLHCMLEEFRILCYGTNKMKNSPWQAMNRGHYGNLRLDIKASGDFAYKGVWFESPTITEPTSIPTTVDSTPGRVYEVGWTDLGVEIDDENDGWIQFYIWFDPEWFRPSGSNPGIDGRRFYMVYDTRHSDFDNDGSKRTSGGSTPFKLSYHDNMAIIRDPAYFFGYDLAPDDDLDVHVETQDDVTVYDVGDPFYFEWQRIDGNQRWQYGFRDADNDFVEHGIAPWVSTTDDDIGFRQGNIPGGYTEGTWDLCWREDGTVAWNVGMTIEVSNTTASYECYPDGFDYRVGDDIYVWYLGTNNVKYKIKLYNDKDVLVNNRTFTGTGSLEKVEYRRANTEGDYYFVMTNYTGNEPLTVPAFIHIRPRSAPGTFTMTSITNTYHSGDDVMLTGYNPYYNTTVVVVGANSKEERILDVPHGQYSVTFVYGADDSFKVYLIVNGERRPNYVYKFAVGDAYWGDVVDPDAWGDMTTEDKYMLGFVICGIFGLLAGGISQSGTGAGIGFLVPGIMFALPDWQYQLFPEQILFLYGFIMVLLFMYMLTR